MHSLSDHVLANKTVKIGYLEYLYQRPWISYMNSAESFIKEIIEPDINEYASKLGYGSALRIRRRTRYEDHMRLEI